MTRTTVMVKQSVHYAHIHDEIFKDAFYQFKLFVFLIKKDL
jgi:hypothetical protein